MDKIQMLGKLVIKQVVTDGYKQLCGFWKSNPDPLEEQ